jgi:hypothetical protein
VSLFLDIPKVYNGQAKIATKHNKTVSVADCCVFSLTDVPMAVKWTWDIASGGKV